ncbi:MAG: hypothetical protein AAB588_00445 [Patescibacteria group bacterium]
MKIKEKEKKAGNKDFLYRIGEDSLKIFRTKNKGKKRRRAKFKA